MLVVAERRVQHPEEAVDRAQASRPSARRRRPRRRSPRASRAASGSPRDRRASRRRRRPARGRRPSWRRAGSSRSRSPRAARTRPGRRRGGRRRRGSRPAPAARPGSPDSAATIGRIEGSISSGVPSRLWISAICSVWNCGRERLLGELAEPGALARELPRLGEVAAHDRPHRPHRRHVPEVPGLAEPLGHRRVLGEAALEGVDLADLQLPGHPVGEAADLAEPVAGAPRDLDHLVGDGEPLLHGPGLADVEELPHHQRDGERRRRRRARGRSRPPRR